MKKAIRIVAAVLVSAALAAAAFGQPASNSPQRLIVLFKPGSEPLPDIAAMGGIVEFNLADRMVVTVPAEAVAAIRSNPRVQYVQRSGAPASINSESLPVVPSSGPGQWSTGAYVYDGAGNISAIGTGAEPNSDARTNAYTYDKVGRLVSGTANYAAGNRSEIYAYDPFGNMTSRTPAGSPPVTFQIDSATNRTGLHNEPGRYDAGGNEISDPAISATRRFDPLNMMTYKHTGGVEENYVYTPDDQRIGVLTAASHTWTWSLRDEGGALLRQYSSSETALNADWLWVEDYVYAGGHLLGAERMASQGGRRHFHLDHLGTPRLITGSDAAATLIARHDYLPFGEEVTLIDSERLAGFDRVEPLEFAGHESDFGGSLAATLDYMHARYYRPTQGRFLSIDPSTDLDKTVHDPQLWNRYSYVRNNPIGNTDPDGKICVPCAVVGGFVGVGYESYRQVRSGEPVNNRRLFAALGLGAAAGATLGAAAEAAPIVYSSVIGNPAGIVTATTIAGGVLGVDVPNINPAEVRFTQDSIKSTFKDGRAISEMVEGLKSGALKAEEIKPIRVFMNEGKMFSLDNRRLYALKEAGVKNVRAVWATAEEIAKELPRKLTTENMGESVRVRQ
jgi:RHS repeat-associated protein